MENTKSFTLIELLVVIAIVGLLVSIVLVALQDAKARARDGKRDAEAGETGGALRKTLEVYNSANGVYPFSTTSESEDGCCLEDDSTIKDAIRPYISSIPQDPLYNPTEPDGLGKYCYRYKTIDNGKEYKIRVNYEKRDYKEVASWGGESISYGSTVADYALQFDGLNDYVAIGNTASLNITSAITLEAWAKGTGANFSSTNIINNEHYTTNPQFQIIGDKIYYVWTEYDGSYYQIWTAKTNTDGTGLTATQKTTSLTNKNFPQFQVVGNIIYYVWDEYDGSYNQIWTAKMNTDGTYWSATQMTNGTYYADLNPQLQVVGDKIYYVWTANNNIWTGEMNTDGTEWSETQMTNNVDVYGTTAPQLQVVGDKIYYVWVDNDDISIQIWTGEMNTDGTEWSATQMTNSIESGEPQLQVVDDKIYYVWWETVDIDGNLYIQIVTAEMNTDGTDWTTTNRTNNVWIYSPQLQVVGNKIHYIWFGSEEDKSQIWTAEMNTDGTDWSITKRTNSLHDKENPKLQVVGNKMYYLWMGNLDDYYKLWLGEMNSNIINKDDFYGIGISNSIVEGFIDAGVNGFKYTGKAINYTSGVIVESTIGSNWNHIVMTYDKSNLKLYVNGSLTNTSAFTETINTNPFNLNIGDDFNGTIDEIRLYNRALSTTEVTEHYNGTFSDETGLVGLWHFNEGSGNITADDSGSGNNGSLAPACSDCPEWVARF